MKPGMLQTLVREYTGYKLRKDLLNKFGVKDLTVEELRDLTKTEQTDATDKAE